MNTAATRSVSHPEFELKLQDLIPDNERLSESTLVDYSQYGASFDLAEIYPDMAIVKCSLHLDSLQGYLGKGSEENVKDGRGGPLRILFVEDRAYGDSAVLREGERPKLNKSAVWIHQQFGISLSFFQYMSPTCHFRSSGSGCFVRSNDHGENIALDGFYQISRGLHAGPVHVWFSHSLLERYSSNSVIYNCSEEAKMHIITCVETQDPNFLLRPLAVDAFLGEEILSHWTPQVGLLRSRLLHYENEVIATRTPTQSGQAVHDLHHISQNFHVAYGNLLDFRERLQFLLHIRQQHLSLSSPRFLFQGQSINSISESLALLRTRGEYLMRWTQNYDERTGIRINMFFNLTTQLDSRTNLDIARLTTKIAISNQKDSSSMITMAAVTMFFLPGSFVSALFSMVFFNSQSTESGQTILSVTPQWWLFPSIAIPLTVLVFLTWVIWQRRRNSTALDEAVVGNRAGIYEDEGSFVLEKDCP